MLETDLVKTDDGSPPLLEGAASVRQRRLFELEEQIKDRISRFRRQSAVECWHVGQALAEVEKQALWRETHPTFEAWLRERTEVTTRWSRKLIEFSRTNTLKDVEGNKLVSLNTYFEIDKSIRQIEGKADADAAKQRALGAAQEAAAGGKGARGSAAAARESLAGSNPGKRAAAGPFDVGASPLVAPVVEDVLSITPRTIPCRGKGQALDHRGKKLAAWAPGAIVRVPVGHDGLAVCAQLGEGGAMVWWVSKRTRGAAPPPKAKGSKPAKKSAKGAAGS